MLGTAEAHEGEARYGLDLPITNAGLNNALPSEIVCGVVIAQRRTSSNCPA